MQISEIAAQTGLSIDTIRFYEKSEISPPIARGADGNRSFTAENLAWFTLLASLRETGMHLKQMAHFAALYQQGDATVPERKQMLFEHRLYLEERQARLSLCYDLLSEKITRYDQILGEKP